MYNRFKPGDKVFYRYDHGDGMKEYHGIVTRVDDERVYSLWGRAAVEGWMHCDRVFMVSPQCPMEVQRC